MSFTTTQRALAEFVGTLALIFVGAGSILINQMTGGGVGLPGIALAHGLTIAVMVSAIGHISGGHINPAVTFGAVLARRISPPRRPLTSRRSSPAGWRARCSSLPSSTRRRARPSSSGRLPSAPA